MTYSTLMLDAAYPPPSNWHVPTHVEVFAGYLGGAGALHVWNPAEIQATQQKVGSFVGIWVPAQSPEAYSSATGAQYAQEALEAAEKASLPSDAIICLDIEHDMATSNLTGCRECAAIWTQELQGTFHRPAGVYAPLSVFQGWSQVPVLAWTPEPILGDLHNPSWTIQAGLQAMSKLRMTTLAPIQAVQVGFDIVIEGINVDISVINWSSFPAPVPPMDPPSPHRLDPDTPKVALEQAQKEGSLRVINQIEPMVRELLAKLQELR